MRHSLYILAIGMLAASVPAAAAEVKEIEKPASTLDTILSEQTKLPEGANEVRVVTATFEPNTAGSWHVHPTPVYVYVTEGELTLEVEGQETKTIKAGQAVAEPLQAKMRAVNRGNNTAKVVVFQISPSDKKFLEAEKK